DIIIGSNDCYSNGEAYIIYGGPAKNNITVNTSMGASIEFQMTGTKYNGGFGMAVGSAGDFNNDGYADVIVGTPYEMSSSQGYVYIIFGNASRTDFTVGASMGTYVGLRISSSASSQHFGWSVSSAGDLNKDNYTDVLIGDTYESAAYVIWGGAYKVDMTATNT